MKEEKFSLGAVVSVISKKLVAPLPEVVGLLNFITGKDLSMMQLPRALDECSKHLTKQYPKLAKAREKLDGQNNEFGILFLRELAKTFGEEVTVEPMPEGAFKPLDVKSEFENFKKLYQKEDNKKAE